MTCEELIRLLKEFPKETRVFTRGYEDGYIDPIVRSCELALNFYSTDEWWYGPHVTSDRADGHEVVKGVYIG